MTGHLILTHGLPASGKTTWAQNEVQKNPSSVVRVNPDDIRTELFGEKYHRGNPNKKSEGQVTNLHRDRIKQGLREGKVVICDDTNLNPRALRGLAAVAQNYKAEVSSKYFDTPIEECKRRNANRKRVVPEHVIDRMAENAYVTDGSRLKRWIIADGQVNPERDPTHPTEQTIALYNAGLNRRTKPHGELQHSMVFDMDGTLVDTRAISDMHMGNNKRDFHRFHMSSEFAPANEDVAAIAHQCHEEGMSVIVVTARMADYADPTINWLKNNDIPVERLYMRASGDYRPDYQVKSDIIRQIEEDGYDIVHAVDDNPQVLRRWHELGVMVTQVPWHTPRDLAEGENPPVYEKQVIPSPINSGGCLRCGRPLKTGNIGPQCMRK